jgi:hypothetical protein
MLSIKSRTGCATPPFAVAGQLQVSELLQGTAEDRVWALEFGTNYVTRVKPHQASGKEGNLRI